MRNLVFIIALLFSSCNLVQKEETKSIIVIDCPEQKEKLPEKYIMKSDWDKIQKMRPFAQDIAVYILLYPENMKYKNGCSFECNKFSLWVHIGIDNFKVTNPIDRGFNVYEKEFIWRLFQQWLNKNYRIYKFEEEVTIKITEK